MQGFPSSTSTFRRLVVLGSFVAAASLAYLLRGVLLPLFFAFLLAYALAPLVDRLEAMKVPRAIGAVAVMLTIAGGLTLAVMYVVPMFYDEIRAAAADLPEQLKALQTRAEPWLLSNFRVKLPHTLSDLMADSGAQAGGMLGTASTAFFGTLSFVGLALSSLVVPVFALYLLIDFDRIVRRGRQLVPKRWATPATDIASQIHRTLGGYVRGQVTACIVLAALYAAGLRLVDIRLAVPIGVLTGMLAFVPYIGFSTGFLLAIAMATLDWHGIGPVIGVALVMTTVQLADAMIVTPRIVGRSVGLAPIEVLLTLMGAGSLFGFLGVLLAVPLGAVVKILVQRLVKVYLTSEFYLTPPLRRATPEAPRRESGYDSDDAPTQAPPAVTSKGH